MKKISVLEKADILKKAGIEQHLKEMRMLISYVLEMPFSKVLGEKEFILDKLQYKKLENFIERRINREPIQYIQESCWFWNYKFKVNEDVLIPRPETEHIVEQVLKLFNKDFDGLILDCCTGSGCVGLTLSKEFEKANVILSDISIKALKIANINKSNLNCPDVNIINCNMLTGFNKNLFNLITANPPYIGLIEKQNLQKEVVDFEPEIALFSENSGLKLIENLLINSQHILKKGGYLIFEFGIGQHDFIKNYVKENLSTAYDCCYTVKDLAGIERIGVLRRA